MVFFLGFGLLAVLLLLVLAAAVIMFSRRASSRVENELAKIREAGQPASAAELEEHYQLPPEEEDTTPLWLQATRPLGTDAFRADAGELPIVGTGESEIPPPGEPWDDLEAAEQFLQKYAASLERLHQAAEVDGAARYTTDFRLGVAMPLDYVQRLREGARLLSLEAHVRAHRGDGKGAVESIHAISMLARSLEREPVLVSHLVRIAFDGMAGDLIRFLLPTDILSEEDLLRLQEDLRGIDYHGGLHQAMLGERVTGIEIFRDPAVLGAEVGRTARFWQLTQRHGFVLYLKHMGRFVETAKIPWPEAIEAADQAEAELRERIDNMSALGRLTHALPELLAPAVGAVFTVTARGVAWNDAADAAIAVELYRRNYGKLPERLEELVPQFLPQVPTDPYDGQPLRYIVREDEYLIYSVGPNRIDDGGTDDGRGKPDVVFRVGSSPKTNDES